MIHRIISSRNFHLAVETILLVGLLISVLTSSSPIKAASSDRPLAALNWYQCTTVDQVAVFDSRIHVHCTSTSPTIGIGWFAVSSTNPNVSRYLSIFETAMISGKRLYLYLDPNDTSGAAWGCASGDCRVIYGAELWP